MYEELIPEGAWVPEPLHETEHAKPPLKFVGGKAQLLPELMRDVPHKFNRYYEPFVGGGALFFALASLGYVRPQKAVLNDGNKHLLNTYAAIRGNVGELMPILRMLETREDESHYYLTRGAFNDWAKSDRAKMMHPSAVFDTVAAARFIYMNKVGYNGLCRYNRNGEFNVPWGHATGKALFEEENLIAACKLLQLAELRYGDFEDAVHDAGEGDFVYFDPPYVPASATSSFTSYTKDGFDIDDQRRLVSVATRLMDRGCHVMLSNADTPVVRELYSSPRFSIRSVEARRAINSNGAKRGKIGELIITGRRQSHD